MLYPTELWAGCEEEQEGIRLTAGEYLPASTPVIHAVSSVANYRRILHAMQSAFNCSIERHGPTVHQRNDGFGDDGTIRLGRNVAHK